MRPKQMTLSETGFAQHHKVTRRAQFLAEMNTVVPWAKLVALIEPHYPTAEGPGRPPIGLERMLRIHFLQHWFNLSDPSVEEALYDSRAMREFVGIDLGREPAPDETTVCKFRHLLEAHALGEAILRTVNGHLARQGFKVSTGTIVDATIISAPSSTKNQGGERDPEMHQTKKGNEWHFGMKAHIGVDSATKIIHSVAATAANVHDSVCCRNCCTGKRRGCGATRPTRDRATSSAPLPRAPRTLRIAATGTAAGSMRSSGARTAPSPASAPGASIRS
jgi:IS5 family transposase